MSKYNKEELEKLILDEDLSYEEIGRRFGVTGNAIKKAAKRAGIILPVRRKTNIAETHNKDHKIMDLISDDKFVDIIENSFGWTEIVKNLGYKQSGSTLKRKISKRCGLLGITPNLSQPSEILNKTKGELFNCRKNWQSARSSIQKLARKIYFQSNQFPKCAVCGYKNHIEVAHIKAVSEFSDEIPISVIDSVSNLIGLCPNHHWEYDNGLLKI